MQTLRNLLIPLPLLFLFLACDVRTSPETDPADLFERGVELFNEESYQQAETQLAQALSLYEQRSDGSQAARVGAYLGQIKLVQGEYRAAIDKYQAAIQHSRSANDFRAEAQLNMLLGDVFLERGEYTKALERLQGALSYYSAFGDKKASAEVEMRLAFANRQAGELERALSQYENAYGYYETSENSAAKAAALDGVGQIYALQGRHPEALNSFTQALEAIGSGNPVLEATLKMRAGLSYSALGRPNDALERFRDAANSLRSRKLARSLESLILCYIGNIYYSNARYDDAKGYYAQAVSVAQSGGDRIAENYNALFALRCDERLLKTPAAGAEPLLQSYSRVSDEFRAGGHRTGEAYARAQMGRFFIARRDTMRAREAYSSAVELNEAIVGEYVHPDFHRPYLDELSVEQEQDRWYSALSQLLLKEKKTEESLRTLERGSDRRYRDRLFTVDAQIRHPQLQQEVLQTREKLRQVRLLEVEWSRWQSSALKVAPDEQSLREEIYRLKNEIIQSSQRIAQAQPNYEPLLHAGDLSLPELQQFIPRGTVVVRFLPADDQLYIFVLTRSRIDVRSSPIKRDALLSLVREYQQLLNDPNVYAGAAGTASVPFMTRFSVLSSRLYDHLLRPVERLYERNLLFIPGREFENFPFHTVERQDSKGNVQYLIELSTVDYLPSLSALRYKTAQSMRTRDVVALGNPTGKNWSIDYELRDVRSFYKGAKILIGLEASWKGLTGARGDIVQITSEFGKFRVTQPFGIFVLSGGETMGESREIPFEKLTEAPVFPVIYCSNLLGEGEGLSAAHALLLRMNGTADVFLNSWYADRKAAKFFSEYFYTHLANGLAPGDAYRQALLNMIRTKDVNHPRSWGQFFHYGMG